MNRTQQKPVVKSLKREVSNLSNKLKMKKVYGIVFILGIFISTLFFLSAVSSVIWSDPDTRTIVIINIPLCSISSSTSEWVTFDGTNLIHTNAMDDCYRSDGRKIEDSITPKTSCCPSNYICNQTTKQCVVLTTTIDGCDDYTNAVDCENNAAGVDVNQALISVGNFNGCGKTRGWFKGSEYCINTSSCKCFWKDNRCDKGWTELELGCDKKHYGNCTIRTNELRDECNTTGLLFYSWAATWQGTYTKPVKCVDGNKRIPCRPSVKLAFFTFLNVAMAILIIIFIYSAYFLLKKGRKNKTRSSNRH